MATMNNLEVRKYLPHRYPFLMIDKVESVEPNKSIVGIKNVTTNEPHFTGHLPEMPVMPGVMIIESLAQAGGILIYKTLGVYPKEDEFFYLAGVDNARFKRTVLPGDQLKLTVELVKVKLTIWKFKGVATVDGEVACSADFMCIQAPTLDLM